MYVRNYYVVVNEYVHVHKQLKIYTYIRTLHTCTVTLSVSSCVLVQWWSWSLLTSVWQCVCRQPL